MGSNMPSGIGRGIGVMVALRIFMMGWRMVTGGCGKAPPQGECGRGLFRLLGYGCALLWLEIRRRVGVCI
jgi:hypothetical protein